MQEANSVISLIVSWLPIILFVATGWYVARQIRRGLFTKDGRSMADVSVELVAELKRINGPAN
jgi:hypothetical protein